jgi:hypothetical protein
VAKASARKRSQSARPDIQRDLAAHLTASQRAHEWAAKCLTYRDAEQTAAANNAEQKARRWLKKAMILESKARGRAQVADRT